MADYTSSYTGAQIDSGVLKGNSVTTATRINNAVTKAESILEWVEAQGESGGWYYQKFSGGQFEAFTSGSLTSSNTSDRKSATFALPFTLPNTIYSVQLTPTTNSNLLTNWGVAYSDGSAAKSTTQFIVYSTLTTTAASSVSIGVDVYIKGYWK